ncbi:MAG: EAL domain-containing protein [Lysobacterales bacterium]|nr:MAG: EAL domain-containing protein [Xanthomonadales bacterium]
MSTTAKTTRKSRPPRGWGLSIALWLVSGFVLVIAAFVTGTLLAKRGTELATQELERVRHEIAPMTRTARQLGESAATFDRAVLASLGTDLPQYRVDLAQAGERLALHINEAGPAGPSFETADAGASLRDDVAAHQAAGFRLAELRESRRSTIVRLEAVYLKLADRISAGGSAGVRVGESVITRPLMQEIALALDAARNDALREGSQRAMRETPGEARFRTTLERYDAELRRSPGLAWLALVNEDYARAVSLRRSADSLQGRIEAERTVFTTAGEALATRIREQYETPAWNRFTDGTIAAGLALERAGQDVADATAKAILAALLVLSITAIVITWPIRRLTAGARRLAAGDLTTRVRPGGASEVDALARTFNRMAEELDAAERAVRSYQAQLEQRVTERTQQLQHLAEHDPLTNLPNRRQLFQYLSDRIAAAAQTGDRLAVLFLDLDNFKTVNDSLGHEFGDRVLTEIGERLRLLSSETGFIARLGGDEFTLVFPFSGSIDEIETRAATLVARFQRPLQVDRREIAIGVSCGAAIYPDHGGDAASLLRAADAALFRAKELGRNRLCTYDPALLVAASNRFRVEQALRRAIDAGEFVLHYQPQVCLGRLETTTVEALLRWKQSNSVIVPAGEFIAIAEQSGLMLDLNDWILEQAARDVRTWRDAGWADARVAINVSAQQFISGDFLGDVERLLARHDLPPDAIELELTENMLQTGAITVETLRSLKLMGIATALDDFGTGYSSLTSLEQLPLTRVKLDRSVLAEVDSNPRAASIANSIIALCRSLGLQVTIEGVERPSQLDFLSASGDVSVQGFLIARPADASEILGIGAAMKPRMRALMEAAERGRPTLAGDDPDGTITRLRRRPR